MAAVMAALVALGVPTPASASLIGELSGTVTGNGAPLPNVWVTLTPVTDQGDPTGTPTRTLTDQSGRYEFPEVSDRAVTVLVRAPLFGDLVDTFWPDVHSSAQAGIIEISSSPVTADVDLPVGGSVTGRVVDAETGAAVPDTRVTALIAASPRSGAVGVPDRAEAPGAFALSGLPPVPLHLRVQLPVGSPYVAPTADGSDSADALRIEGGARTSGVVVRLRRAATIRGTVLDDAGAPVAGAGVRLIGCLPGCPPPATTDSSGRYQLVPVAPGTGLSVEAVPGGGLLGPLYPGRQATARATGLSVDAGQVVDAPDVILTRPAYVSADLASAGSEEPVRLVVRLTSTGRTYSQYFAVSATGGSAAGGPSGAPTRLRVGPVPPGSYSLSISPGVADIGQLPTRWVTDSGTPGSPMLDLAAGEEAVAVIRVDPSGGAAEIDLTPAREESHASWPAARSDQDGPDEWPGLAQGFLASVA